MQCFFICELIKSRRYVINWCFFFFFSDSGMDKCNTSLVLDTTEPALIVDFNVTMEIVDSDSETCYYMFDTADTAFFGMKALSTGTDSVVCGITNCSVEISLSGNNRNRTECKLIPSHEINVNTNGPGTVEIKIDKCITKQYDSHSYRLLIFKYSDINCSSTETMCSKSTRCVHPKLACNDVYDFCHNNFLNCERKSGTTNFKNHKRRGPTSVRGIILGSICLTALLAFLLYIIACRKQPCCRRIAEKLCRLLPDDRRRGRTVPNVQCARETTQVNLHTNSCQDPPPSYTDIEDCYPNQTARAQPLSETAHVQHHSETGGRSLNIPPPLYSLENTDTSSDNIDYELPPPYSEVIVDSCGVQHI